MSHLNSSPIAVLICGKWVEMSAEDYNEFRKAVLWERKHGDSNSGFAALKSKVWNMSAEERQLRTLEINLS